MFKALHLLFGYVRISLFVRFERIQESLRKLPGYTDSQMIISVTGRIKPD